MEPNKTSFIRTDNNVILNERCIRWVKKMDECLAICSRSDGCILHKETLRVCKINNADSYNRLNQYFE